MTLQELFYLAIQHGIDADSHGRLDRQVRNILAGIDIETPELLLADRLNEKGAGIDLVLAHHPEGRAYANFYEVMKMQADNPEPFRCAAVQAVCMTASVCSYGL